MTVAHVALVFQFRQLHENKLELLRQQLQGKEAEMTSLKKQADDACKTAVERHHPIS